MGKMWEGRFSKALDQTADDFNSSISFDKRKDSIFKNLYSAIENLNDL